jgi:hypothetical protein
MLAHAEIQIFQQNFNNVVKKILAGIEEYLLNYYNTIKIGSSLYRTTLHFYYNSMIQTK